MDGAGQTGSERVIDVAKPSFCEGGGEGFKLVIIHMEGGIGFKARCFPLCIVYFLDEARYTRLVAAWLRKHFELRGG